MTEQDRLRAIRRKLACLAAGVPGRPVAFLPTGLASLDKALGTGGLPLGAITEIFGGSGSGKTAIALQLVRSAQSRGAGAAWIDVDRSFDPASAAAFGISLERLPVARPDSAEHAFAMAAALAASRAISLLVVDPAAALVPAAELLASVGTGGPGLHGRVLASGLRKLAADVARTAVALVFLNQTRSRAAGGMETNTTAGGPALKLYAALRIALEPAGSAAVRFRVVKNKAGEVFARGHLRWIPGAGFAETPECGPSNTDQ